MSMNFCRSSSLECRLIRHAIDCAECADSSSGGPNIISDGHHQRSTASWAIARCAGVPWPSVCRISNPCRWWNDSSLQIRTIARAYGPYEQRQSATWLVIAAPSTSQPIAPTSAQVRLG